MKKYLLALAVLTCLAGPNSTNAQAGIPEDPAASRLTQALIDSLTACERKGGSEYQMGYCEGTRFGILEAYLIAAGRCHENRQDVDCSEASRLRPYITEILEASAKR